MSCASHTQLHNEECTNRNKKGAFNNHEMEYRNSALTHDMRKNNIQLISV